ncbi:MAG: isoprenyl transferase [Bacteroidales bacterium]
MNDISKNINPNNIPKHIAIIMDGNGRWAKKQSKPRVYGHQKGVSTVKEITEEAARLGVKYLTLYTFSTENWNRPTEEVDALMDILVSAIENETPELMSKGVRIMAIGDTSRLSEKSRETLRKCIETTSNNTTITVVLAISYSARWEIINAVKNVVESSSHEYPLEITESLFEQHLTTHGIPDPELLIRTGGEQRISNFLLWQIAYSELYFTDEFWPEFSKESLHKAIVDYQERERRFGKTSEQL